MACSQGFSFQLWVSQTEGFPRIGQASLSGIGCTLVEWVSRSKQYPLLSFFFGGGSGRLLVLREFPKGWFSSGAFPYSLLRTKHLIFASLVLVGCLPTLRQGPLCSLRKGSPISDPTKVAGSETAIPFVNKPHMLAFESQPGKNDWGRKQLGLQPGKCKKNIGLL